MRNTLDLYIRPKRELENRDALSVPFISTLIFLKSPKGSWEGEIAEGNGNIRIERTYSPHWLRVHREELRIHIIHRGEILHVGQKYVDFDDVVDAASGCFKYRF